ncbi:MAG: glucose-1-phosphate thymidylyltransferase [Thermoplasmatales archaeon]
MKGIILHGGSGSRLRPLTYSDVKQLLPIAGKPISEYALQNLVSIGISEVNIVIGSVGGEEVKRYYGDGARWGVSISYTYQEKPLGIAHAISLTRDFVGDDNFVVFLGDNFLQDGISSLYHEFTAHEYEGMIALVRVSDPSQFGIAEVEGDKIVKLVEKPKQPRSDLAIVGVYFLSPEVFRSIDKLKPSARGELEITEAYQDMIESGRKIGYAIVKGWFKDTGTVDDFIDCNRLVLDRISGNVSDLKMKNVSGRVYLGKDSFISERSRVLGPCYIGPGTKIDDSYIGPFTSIGSNCVVKDSEIEDSIVMDGTEISLSRNYILRQCLIGSNVRIKGSGSTSRTLRFVLGRDSKLEF